MSAKRICIEKDKKTSDDDKVQKVVINSLDYDSLAQIFMLLPVPERIDIEGVCVKWKEACQLSCLPKEINEIHLFFESLLDQKQTRSMRMHGSSYEASRELSAEVLYTIFCTCKNLKHLDIVHCRNDVAEIPLEKWISFQNLQYLAISCNMTPDLADTIVKYCKNLKHLRINNRHHIINTALKTLTELENLECLILLNCIKLNKESIIAISNNCKKLKRLEISIRSIYDPPSSLSDLDEISKLQYLEHLKLCIGKSLKDSTIIAIANNCKNLKSLEIAGCSAITETALVALTKLDNLQKLDVSFLHITDSFISKLKGLKELHCDFCEQLTEAGFIQLIKNNPDLKEISVLGTDSITIDLVIAADQATKHRTNGIILHIRKYDLELTQAFKSIIKSQWLVVK
ncbi:F-box/LRR-repeat protein 20-like [Aphidius gifuensis]|uniref:F-box/LRR-repeat protein 20-like n=1 Tax=Aphidius gifuensis TaxID=684658 RepID=UPI001CDCCD60|nr:F-box/LRR-repeat protein 20-like [Aphidius gifuensis]